MGASEARTSALRAGPGLKNMATADAEIVVDPDVGGDHRRDEMVGGTHRRPRASGGMGKPVDEAGFSDHFPIGVVVTEAD